MVQTIINLSSVGDKMLFECTGILTEILCADATSVLTEASIVGSSDFQTIDNLTVDAANFSILLFLAY